MKIKQGDSGMKQKQKGAVVIMEAAFVFPVMFVVVFMLLMACEGYYQYSRVQRACVIAAIEGAARCENPMLETVQTEKTVPMSPSAAKVRPYRYIFTSQAKQIADGLADELEKTIEEMNVMAFRGMKPTNVQVQVTPKMNILVSSISVDCSFDIQLPIRMIFSNENLKFRYTVRISEPIGDPSEFVRNVSTVQDFLERSQLGEKIETYTSKIREALEKLARFTN